MHGWHEQERGLEMVMSTPLDDSPALVSVDSGSTPEERMRIALSNVIVTQFDLILRMNAEIAHLRGGLLHMTKGNAAESARILSEEISSQKTASAMRNAFDAIQAWAELVNG